MQRFILFSFYPVISDLFNFPKSLVSKFLKNWVFSIGDFGRLLGMATIRNKLNDSEEEDENDGASNESSLEVTEESVSVISSENSESEDDSPSKVDESHASDSEAVSNLKNWDNYLHSRPTPLQEDVKKKPWLGITPL